MVYSRKNKKELWTLMAKLEGNYEFFTITAAYQCKPIVLTSEERNPHTFTDNEANEEAIKLFMFLEHSLPWKTLDALVEFLKLPTDERLEAYKRLMKERGIING